MANRFPLMVLTVSTIFVLIGSCTSLPFKQVNPNQNDCETEPHVFIINETTGDILRCHACPICQEGFGLSTPCESQNVSQTLNMECKPCVHGVNYSTGETVQCQPCVEKKCKAGEKVEGECEITRDKRKCQRCEVENHYYNVTQDNCLPCTCRNMTDEIKQICHGLGIYMSCDNSKPSSTAEIPSAEQNDEDNSWNTKYIIVIVIAVFLLASCSCFVTWWHRKHRLGHSHVSLCSEDWLRVVFCCKDTPRCHSSCVLDDRQVQNGNPLHVMYQRQTSCPTTEHERMAVNFHKGKHTSNAQNEENNRLLPECKVKALKFFGMNSETCRQVENMLMTNVDCGMGYVTLGGEMGFSADDVESFKVQKTSLPSKNMLKCWTSKSINNNVLMLKELVSKCQRADIVELLDKELEIARNACDCYECKEISRV